MNINRFVIDSIIENTSVTLEELYEVVCSDCKHVFTKCNDDCGIIKYIHEEVGDEEARRETK